MRNCLASCIFCCVLATPAWGAGPDGAQDDPWILLEKAGQAARHLNYRGVFVYQSGRVVNAMQITHVNHANDEFARVILLDGAPREMLRQGRDAVIYDTRNEKVVVDRRMLGTFPAALPELSTFLRTGYQARLGGPERVGGRDGVVIHLEPRDRYRYGCRLAVDRESGLLLKSVMLGERNDVIEQVAFSQVALMPEPDDMNWFRPEIDYGKPYVMRPEEKVMSAASAGDRWILGQLPPGYRQIDRVQRNVPGKAHPVTQMIFSDGIASVSLFVEPLDPAVPRRVGHMLQGATHVYANVVEGHQLVVAGEVPAITVRQIAHAVSFRK